MADPKSLAIAREQAEAERAEREQQIAQRLGRLERVEDKLDRLLALLEPADDKADEKKAEDEKKTAADKPKK